jgi:hypothetical protein
MPTCKQIIELASTSLEIPLPRGQRWQLQLHLFICRHCRRYFKQLRFLQQASLNLEKNLHSTALSAAARERIAKKLQQQSEIQP